ncbi:hypothetical protein ACI79C_04760 [Geodermatophilus sp. SYSU D00697]
MLDLESLQDEPRREVAMLQWRAAHHRRWALRLREHLLAAADERTSR